MKTTAVDIVSAAVKIKMMIIRRNNKTSNKQRRHIPGKVIQTDIFFFTKDLEKFYVSFDNLQRTIRGIFV